MTSSDGQGWEKLTKFAFALAMGTVLARGMMLETIREASDVVPGQEVVLRMPGATVTVVLDFLSFIPAMLVAMRAARDERYSLRFVLSPSVLGAIGILAIASILWSDDRFAAAVSSGKLLAGAILGWSLVQCVRDWRSFRVVMALCIGLFAVNLVRSIVYVQSDLPEMISTWEQQEDELLRERGIDPGSFHAEQFERRIRAGELLGFNASPNTLAAMVAMMLVVLTGDLLQRISDKRGISWVMPLVLMAGGGWIIWRTDSMTAMATPIIGVSLLVMGWKLRGWLGRWRKSAFAAGVIVLCAAWAAVIAHGFYHGSLIQRSLTFRWHYWVASLQLFKDNLLAGVGWENFGPRYLQYRLPMAPEEIRDPHNLFVRFATELGVVGLLLGIGWLLALAWGVTRPAKNGGAAAGAEAAVRGLSPIPGIVGISFVVLALASCDFSQDFAAGLYDAVWKGMYCFVLLAVAAMFAAADTKEARLSSGFAGLLAAGVTAGLAVFVIHNFIDFALFETGTFYLFIAISSALIGLRASMGDVLLLRRFRGVILAKLLVLWLAFGVVVALPVVLSETSARRADEQLARHDFSAAAQSIEQAFTNSAWLSNGEYLLRKGRIESYAGAPSQQVARSLLRAIEANPRLISAWLAMGSLSRHGGDGSGVVDYYGRAIALNPTDVGMRLEAADAMLATGAKDRAAQQYEASLELNELLPEEEPERLSETRVSAVRETLRQLREGK